MAIGQVTVTQENTGSGGIDGVERKSLWIGIGGETAQAEQIHALNAQSDLDAILGEEESELKTNIKAVMVNAGANFTAYVFPLLATAPNYTWDTALEFCLDAPNDLDVELVAIVTPMTSSNLVDEYQAACDGAVAQFAKYISIHAATPGIAEGETLSEYAATTKALQTGKAAKRVYLVPQLHGNNLGVVVGRLCNSSNSLGDSPMRVASGPVVGLGPAPVDSTGKTLTMAELADLAANRFSVPQTYTGFDGTYWADHVSLDAEGGDFQVYENLRVIDYLTRRIRVLAIQKIADRSLNKSAGSIAYHQGYFLEPILKAAKSTTINGQPKPGLVKPVQDGDMVITWKSNKEVDLHFMAAPLDSPKKINAFISLDLNREG